MLCQPDGLTGPGGQGSGLDAGGNYTSIVTISRVTPLAAGGLASYRTRGQPDEVVVLSGLPASIQYVTRGPEPLAKVPGDTVGRSLWRIFIPVGAVALGAIRLNDVATDNLGRRYKLNEPMWGIVDVQLEAEDLRA